MSDSKRMLSLMLKVGATAGIAKVLIDNSAVILGDELAGPGEAGECFCNRDLTLEECSEIIEKLRDSEGDVQQASGYSLFGASNCNLPSGDKTMAKFNEKLNQTFNKYDINTCIRKIHFIAQIYHETDRLRTTKEYARSPRYAPYVGRGLMQLTWESNYKIYESYSGVGCVDEPELIAENIDNAFDSAGWYWKQGKVLSNSSRWRGPRNPPSYVAIHKPDYPKTSITESYGGETIRYGTVDLNLVADDDRVDIISYLVNGGANGMPERRNYVTTLKRIFKYPQTCVTKGGSPDEGEPETDTVTIRLNRRWETSISTIGEFTIDGSDITGFMLEEKGPDTTVSGREQRVPVGTYNLVWHNGTRFQHVLKLYNSQVSQSRAILIHGGNTADDTEGCLLPGTTRGVNRVNTSQAKLREIIAFVEEKGIEGARIIITANYE